MSLGFRRFEMPFFRLMLSFLFVLCCTFNVSNTFNVEWKNAVKHRGPGQSMFGFSIAQHKENGQSWVIIGAPEAYDLTQKYGPDYRGGAVFYCDSDRNDSCTPISFTDSGNYEPLKIDNRTRQWLGATVRSSGENGMILACAPRYFWFRSTGHDGIVRDPVGTCYTAKNLFRNSEEYSPCRTKGAQGYSKQGSCQVGFGAAITKDASRMYLGAVGSFYWQGEVFSIHTILKLPFTDDQKWLFNEETGQLISLSKYSQPELMSSKEGPISEDDSYMGYSVETISFFGNNISGAVVGTPRGAMLNGKVQILTWNLTNVKNLTGDQFGSYFGYSLAVADVNGDGGQDIIVGAPMFSNYTSSQNEYEKGRVYVYYQSLKPCGFLDFACWDKKFSSPDTIDGEFSKSRFGLSVAALGDINQDGFEDFAVGAPYEGTIGDCMKSTVTGAVYIYHGSRYGVRQKYSQRITAEQLSMLSQSPLTTFGFALSGGLDLDNNQYPDLAVGAYESDTVYLFRSRPVINLKVDFRFLSNTKMIEFDQYPNCRLLSNSSAHCVNLQMCLQYNGTGVSEIIDLRVDILLDVKKPQTPRMFFKHNENAREYTNVFNLQKNAGQVCHNMVVYVIPLNPNQDKLTPLDVEMRYELREPLHSYDGELRPILNMDDETPLSRHDSMRIKNNCGQDNVCIPELHMRVTSNVKQYILGSGSLFFNVSVENRGEDSFGSVFQMRMPPGVHYSKFEHFAKNDNSYVHCFPPKSKKNQTISCNIGNPLPKDKNVNFSITLHPKEEVDESELNFSFWVNSTIPQVMAMSDTESHMSIAIMEETSLQIDVASYPKEVYYNISQYNFDEIETDLQAGPLLKHVYTIKNLGPSEVSEANVVFYWPYKTIAEDDLLYLLNPPLTSGNIQCQTYSKDNYNYRHLKLARKAKDENEQEIWPSSSSHTAFTEVPHKISQGYKPAGSMNNINNKGGVNVDKHQESDKWYTDKISTDTGSNSFGTNKNNYFYESNSGGYVNNQNQQQGYQGSNQAVGGSYHIDSTQRTGGSYHVGSGYQSVGTQQVGGVYQSSGTQQGSGTRQIGGGSGSSVLQTDKIHQTSSTYHGGSSSQQNINDIFKAGGSQQVDIDGGGIYQTGGTHQFRTGVVYVGEQKEHSQGGYSAQDGRQQQQQHGGSLVNVGGQYGGYESQYHSSGSGGSQGNFNGQTYGPVLPANKNYSSVHESESSYTKKTKYNENGPVTFVDTKWRTNDNGVIRNGSFSTISPGFIEGGHFFGSEDVNMQTTNGGGFSNVANTGGGRIINRQKIDSDGSVLTVYSDGVQRVRPEVITKGNESETVYRSRIENTQLLTPNKLPDGRVVYSPAKPFYSGNTAQVNRAIDNYRKETIGQPTLSQDEMYDDDNNDEENENENVNEGEEETDEILNDKEQKKNGHRRKRQSSANKNEEYQSFCTADTCARVECTIKQLSKDHEVSVTFRSLVWIKTIKKLAFSKPVQVGSYAEVNITKLPHVRTPKLNTTYSAEILTNVTSLDHGETAPDVIPLWIVVSSACFGALILMLLVYLLYRTGFFKRNRPPALPERQPLNRNGNYHFGDEAL